ncbi:MAG TPA: four helix bundle protein [Chitinophagaceae bacterium]|nr:four helix bundle protein [Chitinophagaceae bacterium]
MATITKFEDLEIWQLSRVQTNDFDKLIETTSLTKDFELRNQMNASSGSVMDCIAECFDRSGNKELKISWLSQKGQTVNSGRSCSDALIESISFRKDSMNCMLKMSLLEIR